MAFVEQYDFDYDTGTNLTTAVSITRKFPRWYVEFVVAYDARYDDYTVMLNLWPEGIPESGFQTQTYDVLGRSSDKN